MKNQSAHTNQSQNLSTLQQLQIKKSEYIKMYGQLIHDSYLSQQSSDISVKKIDEFPSFSDSSSVIKNVTLYSDIPYRLLDQTMPTQEKQRQRRQKQLRDVFEKTSKFVIFDSLVIDNQINDREIELARNNRILQCQVEYLREERAKRQMELRQLKAQISSKKSFKTQKQKIFKNLDTKTQTLKQRVMDAQIFDNKAEQKINQAFELIENIQKSREIRLKKKLKNMDQNEQDLEKDVKQMNQEIKQIYNRISEKRQTLRDQKRQKMLYKQLEEIQKLENSINKMEEMIKNMNNPNRQRK